MTGWHNDKARLFPLTAILRQAQHVSVRDNIGAKIPNSELRYTPYSGVRTGGGNLTTSYGYHPTNFRLQSLQVGTRRRRCGRVTTPTTVWAT